MKFLVGILAVVGALSIVGFGALFYWSATGGADRMSREMHELKAQGAALGAATDTAGCVREAYSRLDACSGAMCQGRVSVAFLGSCLEFASPNLEACEDFEGLVTEERDWTSDYCELVGQPYDTCLMVIPYLLQHCQALTGGAAYQAVAADGPPHGCSAPAGSRSMLVPLPSSGADS
jgi:hypothetical protein